MRFVTVSGIAFATLFSGSAMAAESHQITLENHSKAAIVRVTFRPLDGKGAKVEVLNRKSIGAGKSRTVSVPTDGKSCKYALLAEFEPDAELYDVTDKLDLCEVGTYTIE
ncbi:hypothetical protein ACQ3G6_10555 [Allorhizobium undicola]|uniref:hypothetical protein n=1 Tax=Allorhizobium undicola TaxID=78527 RepID=UPI000684DA36|nr:hypothetical protein [Allorhizobium undicola]